MAPLVTVGTRAHALPNHSNIKALRTPAPVAHSRGTGVQTYQRGPSPSRGIISFSTASGLRDRTVENLASGGPVLPLSTRLIHRNFSTTTLKAYRRQR